MFFWIFDIARKYSFFVPQKVSAVPPRVFWLFFRVINFLCDIIKIWCIFQAYIDQRISNNFEKFEKKSSKFQNLGFPIFVFLLFLATLEPWNTLEPFRTHSKRTTERENQSLTFGRLFLDSRKSHFDFWDDFLIGFSVLERAMDDYRRRKS